MCTQCPSTPSLRSHLTCALVGGPLVRGPGGPGALASRQTRTVTKVTSLATCLPCHRKERMEMVRVSLERNGEE